MVLQNEIKSFHKPTTVKYNLLLNGLIVLYSFNFFYITKNIETSNW